LAPLDESTTLRRPNYGTSDSKESALAKGVLSFDLFADGTVLYTDGSGIYSIDRQGKSERLTKDALIEQVVAVEA
jgi:hypothetical protein